MELLHMKYFQKIARLGSITQAAQELHVSQPAMSKMLACLEKELGQRLFDRSNRKLHLNAAGKSFLSHVDRIFVELQYAQEELQSSSLLMNSQVVIGAVSSRLLPDLLTDYIAAYPQRHFQLRQITDIKEMKKSILTEKIDMALSFEPILHTEITSIAIRKEELFLAVSPKHPLANKGCVSLAEIRNENFISLTSECGLRETMTEFCRQAGFVPHIAFEINSLEVIANLVNMGMGIAFLPACWHHREHRSEPIQIPLIKPECHRTIWLSYSKVRCLTEGQRRFLDFIVVYFKKNKD